MRWSRLTDERSATQSFKYRCYSLSDNWQCDREQIVHRYNDKPYIKEHLETVACSVCVCLVSQCVWMRLAPLFHNTGSCADSTCDTDRFMGLLHSTQLCCLPRHVCIQCCVWICVSCTMHLPCMCVYLCSWMHLLQLMHVFVYVFASVCEKKTIWHMMVEVIVRMWESVSLFNRKRRIMKIEERSVRFIYFVKKMLEKARCLPAGGIYLTSHCTTQQMSTNQHVVPMSLIVNNVVYGDREQHTSFHNKNTHIWWYVLQLGFSPVLS